MLNTTSIPQNSICTCTSHVLNQTIFTDCPDIIEISKAIGSISNNKSPGLDNIPPELLKTDRNNSARLLEPVIRAFWNDESIADELNFPQKGNLTIRKKLEKPNYAKHGQNKVIANIRNKRLSKAILLRREQAGFRSNKSCDDKINSLRIIVEQSVEWRSPSFVSYSLNSKWLLILSVMRSYGAHWHVSVSLLK